uniref:B30.2/SPRY domain-containing protein n=1 Tax=Panagrolaimus sp. JU765 TaxID=591449 RepID=A0AC34QHL8_9BILA
MVNFLPISMDISLSANTPTTDDNDMSYFTIPSRNLLNDDRMEIDEPSFNYDRNLTRSFDEAVPSSDEIYHAVVRFVDATEAVNGHFVPIEAPIPMEDDDDVVVGDVILSSDSDEDSDSTATSWKSVTSRLGEDNENRSSSSPDTGIAPPTTTWEAGPSTPFRYTGLSVAQSSTNIPINQGTTTSNRSRRGPMQLINTLSRRRSDSLRQQSNTTENSLPNGSTLIPKKRTTKLLRTTSPAYPPNHPYETVDDCTRPIKFDYILNHFKPDEELMEKYSWNPDDRSLNIFVKEDDHLTFHRHPVAQSTDCIRGKVGFTRGFHVWKLTWPQRQRGTHAVVGVATKTAPLHQAGYTSLIGHNNESYGWDLTRNKCYHDGQNTNGWTYPITTNDVSPDSFYCILDMDEGYLAFATEEKFLGVAFRGLKGKKLYPIVSAVWGHCEVTMKYLGSLDPEPKSLMEVCRRAIRYQTLQDDFPIQRLPLPPSLKRYIDANLYYYYGNKTGYSCLKKIMCYIFCRIL